ncbi:hypothetical protein TNCV_4670981 [Trichonephila clavipes]|nr:hypothetical protein TNCV_4670981 [Trichonephila clavipes]
MAATVDDLTAWIVVASAEIDSPPDYLKAFENPSSVGVSCVLYVSTYGVEFRTVHVTITCRCMPHVQLCCIVRIINTLYV